MNALEKIRQGVESVGRYWSVKLKHEEPTPAAMFQALGKLGVAFRQTIEKPFFLLAHEHLAEFDLVDIQTAVKGIIQHGRFFPTIAEIRDLAVRARGERASEASRLIEDEAMRAYEAKRRG